MNVDRMLARCAREQWRLEDLDWTRPPPELDREREITICQCFTDMSAIELLAAALFEVQRDRARDPRLRELFQHCVGDELRHAAVAARLAQHYDVHAFRRYQVNPHLRNFQELFVAAARELPPAIANAYVTTGELLLDIALLRSLGDYVNDDMCRQAMRLINRDESRHIAVDYAMTEYYASADCQAAQRSQLPRSLAQQVRAGLTLIRFLHAAQLFFRHVFFATIDRVDPSGQHLLNGFKRVQLLGRKRGSGEVSAFARAQLALRDAFNHPLIGRLFGRAIAHALGLPPRVLVRLYTEHELHRAQMMSFDQLAREALLAKYSSRRLNGGTFGGEA